MKYGFVGTGNMGGAILKGCLEAKVIQPKNVFAMARNREKLEELCHELHVTACVDTENLVSASDVVIMGIKPNGFEEVMPQVKAQWNENKILVSMAAGITISYIEGFLGKAAKVIRIMPNTPAMVGEGMISVSRNQNVSDEEFEKVFSLFTSIGKAQEVPEELIHCVIGVSGSSPAYTYMYIDALADAAVQNGMCKEQAVIFAAQSVLGAAKMVLETGVDPMQLRKNVCSPGGTTIEAVDTLMENGFVQSVQQGFQAAVEKSK